MATRQLFALLLLLGAAGAGVFLLTREPPSSGEPSIEGMSADDTPPVPVVEEAEDLQTPQAPLDVPLPAPQQAARAEVPEEVARWSPPSSVVWVEGRVTFAPDTPEDERITVLAHGKSFPGKEKAKGVYEAEVETSGSFRVAFMPKTKRARLTMRARYSYLPKSVRFKIDEVGEGGLTLEPLLGGRIEGTLGIPSLVEGEDLDDRDIIIQVDSWRGNDNVMRTATPAADGAWEVNGLPPGASYEADATSVAFTRGSREDLTITAGETLRVDFDVTRGATVSGVVVDGRGEPVEGARVRAEAPGSYRSKETRSDESGQFVLKGTTPGEVTLEVQHKDFLETEVAIDALAEGDHREGVRAVFEGGGVIEGIVQWPDGTPVAKATVRVDQSNEGEDWRWRSSNDATQRTDEGGTFRYSGLGTGACTIQAHARAPKSISGGKRVTWRAVREGVLPDTGRIALVLEEGRGLVGRVIDDRGEPVPHFRIKLRQQIEGTGSGPSYNKVFKDDEGAFEFVGIAPGEWSIQAEILDPDKKRGIRRVYYGHDDLRMVRVPQDEDLVVTLQRPATITGVVLDPAGDPLPGVEVEVHTSKNRVHGSVTTDSDGAFVLSRIEPGKLELHAEHDQFADAEPLPVDVAPASELEGIRLSMQVGGRIVGEVISADGKVEGLQVSAAGYGVSKWKQTTTDNEGKFEIAGLPADNYRVKVDGRSAPSSQGLIAAVSADPATTRRPETVEVFAGQTARVTLGQGPQDPVRVTGIVSRAGEPVAGVKVGARRADNSDDPYGASTDDAGRFDFLVDGAGKYRFTIERGRGSRVEEVVEIPAGADFEHDFVLPAASVRGTVRGPNGKSVRTSVVLAYSVEKDGKELLRHRRVRTRSDGEFTFEFLEPGSYELTAGGVTVVYGNGNTGYAPAHRSLELSAGDAVEGIDFELERGGSFRILFVSTGLDACTIQVSIDGGTSWQWGGRSGAVVGGLPMGRVLARTQCARVAGDPIEVVVQGSETAEVEF